METDGLPTLPCRVYSEGPLGSERSMPNPVTMLSGQMCDLRSHAPASCDSMEGHLFCPDPYKGAILDASLCLQHRMKLLLKKSLLIVLTTQV